MRIETLKIKNFRAFASVEIPFDAYTRFVGPNGAGKSTALYALNIFFRYVENSTTDVTRLTAEDFHCKNTKEPIEITVTFTELSTEAKIDFSDYVRQDKLIITASATFDSQKGFAEVKQYGQRLGMPVFKEFFKRYGDNAKIVELRESYNRARSTCVELPDEKTKDAMAEALQKYERQHPEVCETIPSEDAFYGVSRGANLLAKYVQWVYVPAVKDASAEQFETKGSSVSKLLLRAVKAKTNVQAEVTRLREASETSYRNILHENQSALDSISEGLQRKLLNWAHPDASVRLAWREDADRFVKLDDPTARVFIRENEFEGELARFGHGLQRSYLLALLHEIAVADDGGLTGDVDQSTLILGIEEPELFQHPPQVRHLSSVLSKLSARAQILITTHSPLFISGQDFEAVRFIRKVASRVSTSSRITFADVAAEYLRHVGEQIRTPSGSMAKIHQALQPSLSEMFFTRCLVLVEGLEDIAYLTSYALLSGQDEILRAAGVHFVPTNKKSEMIQPLLIATRLGIPVFAVFDSDAAKPERNGNGSRNKAKKDNKALLSISGFPKENPLPKNDVWKDNLIMWADDIGSVVKKDAGEAWSRHLDLVRSELGHVKDLEKNMICIGRTMACCWDDGQRFETLEKAIKAIIRFAQPA